MTVENALKPRKGCNPETSNSFTPTRETVNLTHSLYNSPVHLIVILMSLIKNPGFCHFSKKLAGIGFLCSMQKTVKQRGL